MIWSCISLCWVLSRCLSCDELVEMMCSSHLTLDPSDLLACLLDVHFSVQYQAETHGGLDSIES